jgi:phosphatidylglycerophosphate synthase
MIRPLGYGKTSMVNASASQYTRAWILEERTQPHVKIWGVSVAERLRRALLASGFSPERISLGPNTAVHGQEDAFLLLRADYVFDERLVRALSNASDTVLTLEGTPVAAHVQRAYLPEAQALFSGAPTHNSRDHTTRLRTATPLELVPAYTATLRKADPPYLLPARQEYVAQIEAHIFAASYKGITDLVTKWVWPTPARLVTRWLANAGVHPNVVTLLSWVLVMLAAWLFVRGDFGLGLVAAWIMTFLDTVDGKLARVTLTSSTVGHVLDHGLDLLHPPFWYLAWAFGLDLAHGSPWLVPATAVIIVGYIVGRLFEGLFMLLFKMEIHCWQPVDSFFRTITARRNPNLILLTTGTFAARPDWGLLLVAGWTICSIGFHTVRLLQACVLHWQGRVIDEWQGRTRLPPLPLSPTRNTPDQSESLA